MKSARWMPTTSVKLGESYGLNNDATGVCKMNPPLVHVDKYLADLVKRGVI